MVVAVDGADDGPPGDRGSMSCATRWWLASNSSCMRSRIFMTVSRAF
jgi:hypothetical protein